MCRRDRDKLFLKQKGGDFGSSRNRQAAPGRPSLTKVGLSQSKKGNEMLTLETDFPLAERKAPAVERAGPAERVKETYPNKSRCTS